MNIFVILLSTLLFSVRILRTQLVNYKEIIAKRVEKHHPVITYQDNMQLARTSMRHLRLSKLQKEKVKQGKMWDFTVRGWRAANINGIEHLFDNEETASKQPRELKSLEYEETKIGKMVALLSAELLCLKSPHSGTSCQHVQYPIIEVHPLR